jgi:DNA-binding MarR family transcriptional regulator
MSSRKRELFDQLIDEVRRSQSATARFDQAVADALGINRTDMRCIDVIQREGTLTAGRLADATGLTSGAMTTALDRLERAGYVRRIRDEVDRRRVLIELTEKTQQAGQRYYGNHMAEAKLLYERYSEAECELLLGFIRDGREFNEREAARVEAGLREDAG